VAVVYPRTMPAGFANQQQFELDRYDWTPMEGARVGSLTGHWPLWRARWSIPPCKGVQRDTLRAWLTSLRGSQKLFFGYDQDRTAPLSGHAFGSVTAWGLNDAERTLLTLQCSGGAGKVLSIGDYIGFLWVGGQGANNRALVRSLETATTDGGGFVTVTVEPAVPLVVPDAASAQLNGPVCLMRLTGETEFGEFGVDRIMSGTVSAIQALLP
jgi:hypothetical protein